MQRTTPAAGQELVGRQGRREKEVCAAHATSAEMAQKSQAEATTHPVRVSMKICNEPQGSHGQLLCQFYNYYLLAPFLPFLNRISAFSTFSNRRRRGMFGLCRRALQQSLWMYDMDHDPLAGTFCCCVVSV